MHGYALMARFILLLFYTITNLLFCCTGIGFGAGAYIVFRVIDYMFGPHYVRCEFSRCETLTVSPSSTDATCDSHSKALQDVIFPSLHFIPFHSDCVLQFLLISMVGLWG